MTTDTRSDELPGYRPVSRLAVASLAAGLGSALVLFTPLAAMVPLVAIALALAALAGIRRAEGRIAGRWVALAALALAVGFVSQATTAAFADRWLAARRARATATAWIESIRAGRLADALAASRQPAPPDRRGEEPPAADRLAAFADLPAVRAVAAGDQPPAITAVEKSNTAWRVRLALPAGSALLLAVEPELVPRGPRVIERWLVTDFTLEP